MFCCVQSACARENVEFKLELTEFADSLEPQEVAAWSSRLGGDSERSKDCDKKNSLTIDELLGVGLGEAGLCLHDFVRLTPSEFRAVTEASRERYERQSREDWIHLRLMTCIGIQPHLTKRLRPQELLPFLWEQEEKENAEAHEDLGKEESQRWFERPVKR